MATTVNNLRDFPRRASELAKAVGRAVTTFQKNLALDVHGGVITETPVDTGKLRSNWLVSVDVPRSDVIAPYFPGRRLGRAEEANRLAAVSQGVAASQALRPTTNQNLFIVNNTPYVETTNAEGTLTTPRGYVQRGIAIGLDRFAKRKKLVV